MRAILLALFSIFLLTIPLKAKAMEITEIAFDPAGADDQYEWVELFNESNQPVELSGYKFFDGSRHSLDFTSEKGSQGGSLVPPQGYVVLADGATSFAQTYIGYSGQIVDTVMSLPNYSKSRTEPVILQLQDATSKIIAESSYLPPAGFSSGYTLEKNEAGSWQISSQAGGTPGRSRPLSPPISYSDAIALSEILFDPEGDDSDHQWVELSSRANEPVLLEGWFIVATPQSGEGAHRYTIPDGTTVAPNGLLVIALPGSFLSHQPQDLTLRQPIDKILDTVTLDSITKVEQSWALFSGGWEWTKLLTPGSANARTQPSPTPSKKSGSSSSEPKANTTSSPKTSSPSSLTGMGRSPSPISTKKSTPSPKLSSKSSPKAVKSPTTKQVKLASPKTTPTAPQIARVAGLSVLRPLNWQILLIPSILVVTFLGLVIIFRGRLQLLIARIKESFNKQ